MSLSLEFLARDPFPVGYEGRFHDLYKGSLSAPSYGDVLSIFLYSHSHRFICQHLYATTVKNTNVKTKPIADTVLIIEELKV